MADLVREQILVALKTAIDAKRTDGTLRFVERWPVSPFSKWPLPGLALHEGDERPMGPNMGVSIQRVERVLAIQSEVWTTQSDPKVSISTTVNTLWKALYPTYLNAFEAMRNTLLVNWWLLDVIPLQSEAAAPLGGLLVTHEVHFRHLVYDPTVAA